MAVTDTGTAAKTAVADSFVPTFAVAGADVLHIVDMLPMHPAVHPVRSPRHASVLLVAGFIPEACRPALYRLHDQLPHPRVSLVWRTGTQTPLPGAVEVAADSSFAAVGNAVATAHRELRRGRRATEEDLLPDEPPEPWRGRGDHGQGGEGMMGGKPFGRPMAMTGEDPRDGLALDASSVQVGPFLSAWPPGLVLDLTLQGDVIVDVTLVRPPFRQTAGLELFETALREPVPIAALERLRAAHHLRAIARFLATRELDALAARFVATAAAAAEGRIRSIDRLTRYFAMSGAARSTGRGLGRLAAEEHAAARGPAMRAAGGTADARTDHDAYKALGFRPLCGGAGDVRSRLRQWLAEAAQSLALARAAGDDVAVFPDGIESPVGRVPGRGGFVPPPLDLPQLLRGLEWDETVAVLASFDTPALRQMCGSGAEPNGDGDSVSDDGGNTDRGGHGDSDVATDGDSDRDDGTNDGGDAR